MFSLDFWFMFAVLMTVAVGCLVAGFIFGRLYEREMFKRAISNNYPVEPYD